MTQFTTAISHIDREAGRLSYRGYDVRDLTSECSYEEVVHLLWHGELPDSVALRRITHALSEPRFLSLPIVAAMSALRTAVSFIGALDPRADEGSDEANIRLAGELTAKLPVIVATLDRLRRREDAIPADPGLSHAANFLYCLTGDVADDLSTRVFESCLTLRGHIGDRRTARAAPRRREPTGPLGTGGDRGAGACRRVGGGPAG